MPPDPLSQNLSEAAPRRARRRILAPAAPGVQPDAQPDATAEEYSAAHAARAKKLRQRLRIRLSARQLLSLGASAIFCALLLGQIMMASQDYEVMRRQTRQKEAQLAALEKQQREEEKRLAYLRSAKGREQLMIERGFIRPGDRILLFPKEEAALGETASSD